MTFSIWTSSRINVIYFSAFSRPALVEMVVKVHHVEQDKTAIKFGRNHEKICWNWICKNSWNLALPNLHRILVYPTTNPLDCLDLNFQRYENMSSVTRNLKKNFKEKM
jgi:hypothetical protein